jgi:hypothetical protein
MSGHGWVGDSSLDFETGTKNGELKKELVIAFEAKVG